VVDPAAQLHGVRRNVLGKCRQQGGAMNRGELDGRRREQPAGWLSDLAVANVQAAAANAVVDSDDTQRLDRVLLQRQTVADSLQFRRLLEEAELDAEMTERGREGEPADSAADDVDAKGLQVVREWMSRTVCTNAARRRASAVGR
jgi:hypothetical protein